MNALPSSSSQLFFLEERRRQCLQDLATLIQKIYRGWKCRTQFLLLKKSQIVVSAWYRRYAVRPPFFSAGMRSRQRIKQNGKTESCIRCFQAPIFSPFFFHLTATKEVPEDQERHHFGAVLHQRMAGAHLHVHCSESSVAGTNYDRNDCLLVIFPLGP